MVLRYEKTCTAEERNPNICTILCHKCMLITLHCELTCGLAEENGNAAGQFNSYYYYKHTKNAPKLCMKSRILVTWNPKSGDKVGTMLEGNICLITSICLPCSG